MTCENRSLTQETCSTPLEIGSTMTGRTKDIDGDWAWVVLACGMGTLFVVGFLSYSQGMITAAMLELYNEDLALTSAVGAVQAGVMNFVGPFAGFLIKRFGCRACTILGGIISTIGLTGASFAKNLFTVMWTLGILTGFGYGLSYTAATVKVGLNFHRMRPLAAGITAAGAGVGMFVGPPVIQILIDYYGLRGSFLIVAGISAHFCVFGCLMRPLPNSDVAESLSIKPVKNSSVTFRSQKIRKYVRTNCPLQIFKNVGFMVYLLSTLCWSLAESACFLHLPTYCIQQGSTKQEASFLFTVMGISNICSRILTGFAANDEGISTLTILFGLMTVAGVCTGLFPLYSRTYGGQVAYAAVFGIYSSGANSLMTSLAVEFVGIDDLATAFGLVSLMAGTGYLIGPPIAGAIVDLRATYRESFIFAGAVFILSGLSAISIPLVHSKKDNHLHIRQIRDRSVGLEIVNENTQCMIETKQDDVRDREEKCETSVEVEPLQLPTTEVPNDVYSALLQH